MNNAPQVQKWYQGWRNIITILSFILFLWPVSVLTMWFLSTWSKKTKLIITAIVAIIIVSIILPYILFPLIKNNDPFFAINFFKNITEYIWNFIILSLFISITLSIFLKVQNKPIKKLWIISGLIIGGLILFLVFMSIITTLSIYNIR
ncbi:MAG: hypothetical protein Q7J11_00860 [Candidatus Roizmanbacteria bacterium]|nr:hypothetical protein [Candidatus Roizmanbacteria bacterium]